MNADNPNGQFVGTDLAPAVYAARVRATVLIVTVDVGFVSFLDVSYDISSAALAIGGGGFAGNALTMGVDAATIAFDGLKPLTPRGWAEIRVAEELRELPDLPRTPQPPRADAQLSAFLKRSFLSIWDKGPRGGARSARPRLDLVSGDLHERSELHGVTLPACEPVLPLPCREPGHPGSRWGGRSSGEPAPHGGAS